VPELEYELGVVADLEDSGGVDVPEFIEAFEEEGMDLKREEVQVKGLVL